MSFQVERFQAGSRLPPAPERERTIVLGGWWE